MSTPASIDTAALDLMLSELRLPTIKALWPQFTAQADREGWPAARLLTALTEHEIADRARRRFQRRLREARLPTGKTLELFDFSVVPTLSKAHVMALCAGDRWLDGLVQPDRAPLRSNFRTRFAGLMTVLCCYPGGALFK